MLQVKGNGLTLLSTGNLFLPLKRPILSRANMTAANARRPDAHVYPIAIDIPEFF